MPQTILTLTLNPTVDKSSSVERIVPEKKLRCESPKYEPGGGGINISRALKRLGVKAETVFLSGGRTGALLENLLKEEGVKIKPIAFQGETRENFIVVDASNGHQFRFGMPGDPIPAKEQAGILTEIENITVPDWVVISGSLPPKVSPSFLRKLIRHFKSSGSKVVVDTSGDALHAAVDEGIFLIKPNLGELASLAGKKELDKSSAEKAAQKLIKEGKAEVVVVSLGAKGAFMCTADEKIWAASPVVKVRSTVGAGDSMVAGMISVLAKGGTYAEVLEMGVACGSATTMAEGTGLFQRKDVDRLYRQMSEK